VAETDERKYEKNDTNFENTVHNDKTVSSPTEPLPNIRATAQNNIINSEIISIPSRSIGNHQNYN
jgi:hypothetical protein